jgi:hypothetical protein
MCQIHEQLFTLFARNMCFNGSVEILPEARLKDELPKHCSKSDFTVGSVQFFLIWES